MCVRIPRLFARLATLAPMWLWKLVFPNFFFAVLDYSSTVITRFGLWFDTNRIRKGAVLMLLEFREFDLVQYFFWYWSVHADI